jgi:hypothetical protein
MTKLVEVSFPQLRILAANWCKITAGKDGGGQMGETSATRSSDVDSTPEPVIEPRRLDCGEPVQTVATRDHDLQPGWQQATHSRVDMAGAGCLVTGLPLPISPTVPYPAHEGGTAVAAAFGPALRSAFDRFRELLSNSWSPDTAYPGTVTQSHWTAGNPRGQCGVTSVWLAEVLSRVYSIYSTFCRGSVRFNDHEVEHLSDHCWLEIDSSSGDQLILDLTCDQAPGFRQVVFELKADLARDDIHYIADERTSDLAPDNPVWRRYQALLFNMVMISAFGASLPHDKF